MCIYIYIYIERERYVYSTRTEAAVGREGCNCQETVDNKPLPRDCRQLVYRKAQFSKCEVADLNITEI